MVTITNLTSGEGGTGPASVNTASITPPANKPIFVWVGSKVNAATPNIPSVSGCNITWTQIATIAKVDAQRMRLTLFMGISSSPTTDVLTISFGGQSQDRATWVVDYATGARTSGSNAANAIVQSVTGQTSGSGTNQSTSLTLTLGAFADSNNATYGSLNILDGSITPGSGFTELAEADSAETNHDSQWKTIADTSVDWSFAAAYGVGIAVELAQEISSASPSQSPSASVSPSSSISSSSSLSQSPSSSASPSASQSPSSSISLSKSPSASVSPSASTSPSSSVSPSHSISTSPSASQSPSNSISLSRSPSSSTSASASPSPSIGYSSYSRGNYVSLPTNSNDLETLYTPDEEANVLTRNDIGIGQAGSGQYAVHQFKILIGTTPFVQVEWEGHSDLAPMDAPVYLQIYNTSTNSWETVDSNSDADENIDFELEKKLRDTTNYKDTNGILTARVYQLSI